MIVATLTLEPTWNAVAIIRNDDSNNQQKKKKNEYGLDQKRRISLPKHGDSNNQ